MNAYTLSDQLLEELLALSPIACTYLGVPGRDHEWDDLSCAGVARRREVYERYREAFAVLPEPTDRWERLAYRVADAMIDEELDRYGHLEHLRDLNSIASTFQNLREVFDLTDLETDDGWDAAITRLETIDRPLAGYRECLEEGRGRGVVVAKRQVRAVVVEALTTAGDRGFFRELPARLEATPAAAPERMARLRAAVDHACAAYVEFAEYLEETYLPDAADVDAVGEERYIRAARRFLGDVIDPVETYHWGWEQVKRLRGLMVETASQIDPDASLQAVIDLLKTDPARSARSREAFVQFMEERLAKAVHDLDGTIFHIPEPIKRVEVKLAPPGGSLGAYYLQPSEDFSRPGSVWWSVGDRQVFPLWDEVSTVYHEGFPGHHLQVGIQVALSDRLSRLHRLLIWYPGYGEGWALYAELLMNELGYLELPEYQLGMLAAHMLRACRVAIDIGSHLDLPIPDDSGFHPGERWTFETAVELLTDYAFLEQAYAESEVTRYLGWPGQAISYKVGERVILELRETLRQRRGPAFTLRDFHDRVLGSGPVGLALLRELVLE